MVDGEVLQTLRELNASIGVLAASNAALVDVTRNEVQTELRNTRRFLVAVLVGVFVLIVIACSNLYLINVTRENARNIYDCTAEEGICFQRGRERTGEAVGAIVGSATADGQVHEDRIVARLECLRITGVDCPAVTPTTGTTTTTTILGASPS